MLAISTSLSARSASKSFSSLSRWRRYFTLCALIAVLVRPPYVADGADTATTPPWSIPGGESFVGMHPSRWERQHCSGGCYPTLATTRPLPMGTGVAPRLLCYAHAGRSFFIDEMLRISLHF